MERYKPKQVVVQDTARYIPGLTKIIQPSKLDMEIRKRKPVRAASTYRGAKRNAMKTQRPYTPKAERHKVAP
jgi:hypothetical protein